MRLQLYPRLDGEGDLIPALTSNSDPKATGTNTYTKTYINLESSYTVLLGPTNTDINRPNGVDWPDEFWLSKNSASMVTTTPTGTFSISTSFQTVTEGIPIASAAPSSSSSDYSGPIIGYQAGLDEQDAWFTFSNGVKASIVIASIFGFAAIIIACIWFCCGKPRRRKLKAEEDMVRYGERIEAQRAAAGGDGVQVPLQTLSGENVNAARDSASIAPVAARGAVGRAAQRLSRHVSIRSNSTIGGGHGLDVPPPQYEEHVPLAHQRLAGGLPRRGGQIHNQNQNAIQPMMEEEEGLVADGKTPLSDIPFEDVMLTPTNRSQASSSQASGSASPSRDFGERHALGNGQGNTYGHTNA